MNRPVLLIGGPWDGRTVEVDDEAAGSGHVDIIQIDALHIRYFRDRGGETFTHHVWGYERPEVKAIKAAVREASARHREA